MRLGKCMLINKLIAIYYNKNLQKIIIIKVNIYFSNYVTTKLFNDLC